MKDAAQLLDLLASVEAEEIEPTRASGGRQFLYDEVGHTLLLSISANVE